MKRLETLMDQYGLIVKTVLVIFWVFWATQVQIPKNIDTKKLYETSRTTPECAQKRSSVYVFASTKINKAESLGTQYTIENYFRDLRSIKLFADSVGVDASDVSWTISQLHMVSWENIRKTNLKQEDIDQARAKYPPETPKEIQDRQETDKWFKKNVSLPKVSKWFFFFYFRSMFLIFFWYLVRMACRKGILETVLADKKLFVVSLIAWPKMFFSYPYNVVREIVVEAELRRIGQLFRKLDIREKLLVRKVANSNEYGNWVRNFETKNTNCFNHRFALTLVVTIFLFIFGLYATSKIWAANKKSNGKDYYQQMDYGNQLKIIPHIGSGLSWNGGNCAEAIIPNYEVSISEVSSWIKDRIQNIPQEELLKEVDHIPNDYLVFKAKVVVLNQIVGEIFSPTKKGENYVTINLNHNPLGNLWAFCPG